MQQAMGSESNVHLKCQFCSATNHLKLSLCDYLKHLRLFQINQADFTLTCGNDGCQRHFTNAGTFQNHIYAVHKRQACKLQPGTTDCTTQEDNTADQDSLTLSNTFSSHNELPQ